MIRLLLPLLLAGCASKDADYTHYPTKVRAPVQNTGPDVYVFHTSIEYHKYQQAMRAQQALERQERAKARAGVPTLQDEKEQALLDHVAGKE